MADSVIQGVVGKLVEYSADAIKKQVRYLCCYSCNVQTLSDEVGKLDIKRQSLQQRVVVDRNNLKLITPDVEAWLKNVEELKTKSDTICGDAEEVKRSCLCKWIPVLHYSSSRKALKTTNNSIQLRREEFPIISTPRMPADIPPVPTTSIVSFKSRDSIEDKIVDALKDPSVYSIGLWGIGGVGKTVMAKKIAKKVRDEKFFEHVVMVVVSQQPDIPKIQSQIANELNLKFSEGDISQQKKLHKRLMDERSILIILDDLWKWLDLEEIGIPSQKTHHGCKLILTSRDSDALTSSGVLVQNIFELKILTKEESWKFFKYNAGIDADDDSQDELVQIAKKVERECMGLPLALKIVACALKGKGISFWNNAVRELEKHAPNNIPGVAKEVYESLLFSFNALEGKEQKDLFLFCCLFPEDYFISTEELLRCVIGLRIFKELENLREARDKIETVLNILLCRSLLIEGDEKQDHFNVRMHDVIRDVGIWIASKELEKHVFLIKHGVNEWPMVEDDNYTCISLLFSYKEIIFPESIVFPKLEFLRLDCVERNFWNYYHVELPKNLFSGMGGLRVLEVLHIQFLPSSIGQLNNLRTLSIQHCKIFETISVLGKLYNLEILNLRYCKFEVLPIEIGDLENLKQMDISYCKSLRRIAFGVVSKLVRLEELVILDSFDNWEVEGGGEEDVACLSELRGLKNLTTLKIEIWNPSVVPRQKPLWVQKLKKYGITVSKCSFDNGKERFQKAILLGKEVENPLEDWIYNMASDAEYVNLEGCNCMKFVKELSENSGNLSCLKQLRLSHFTNIQYLVEGLQNSAIFIALESLRIEDSVTLEQIFEVSPKTRSFEALQSIDLIKLSGLVCLWKFSIKEQLYLRNLQKVKIDGCDNLSYLFSLYVVQSLVQLNDLKVSNCRTIKEIFKREDGELEINKIKLPKLRKIHFGNLDSFYGLCSEIDRIELPELCELTLDNLPRMKMLEGDNNEAHQKYLISKVDNVQVIGISLNFRVLRELRVKRITNFKCMFSLSIIGQLSNLKYLLVEDCSMLEEVIGRDDENVGGAIIFPHLKNLGLSNLPNIRSFCSDAIQFPSLEELYVDKYPLMLNFVEEFTDHISNSRHFLDNQVQCPKLETLELNGLNIFRGFSPLFFKSLTVLEQLYLINCEGLEHIIAKEEAQIATNTKVIEKDKGKNVGRPIIFPHLYVLHLSNLPNIRSFSCDAIQFPSLEELYVYECRLMLNFVEEFTDHISNSRPFLDNQVQCPKLTRLRLDRLNISRVIENDEEKNVGSPIIFPNLCVLRLSNLPNIRSFCCDAIQFPSLEHLDVSECPLMLNFVEEFTDHISNSRPFLNNQVQCPKLEILNLDGLNISSVFSPLFFKSLTVLTRLHLSNCEELKHIIAKEEGQIATNKKVIGKDEEKYVGAIIFPNLHELMLFNLPNIRSFCCDAIQFPSLRKLSVGKCPLMLNFVEEFTDHISNSGPFLDNQVQCPKLESLYLDRLNISSVFSPLFFKSLTVLTRLHLPDCEELKHIIAKEEGQIATNMKVIEKDEEKNVGGAIISPNLYELRLLNLPSIRSFCCDAIQFPSLEILNVSKCPLMLNFVEEFTNHISNSRPFLDNQVQCPKLKNLTLESLNISGVFSFFKFLTVLEKLALNSCEELEHLIFKEEGQTAEGEFIQMVPLQTFYLIKMPKLYGSIFQMKHSMKFPSLEEIIIEDCPMLEKFSIGSPHLPNLKSVSGLQSAESFANFFSYKEIFPREIHLKNKCFIISHKDISFSSNMVLHFFRSNSSESFVDVVSNAALVDEDMEYEIVGKFEIENIRMGIEYEVMLMILSLKENWYAPLQIRLKLHEGSELQHTKTNTDNYQRDTLIDIPIGKFVGESQQSKQLEFSLSPPNFDWDFGKVLSIKGVKIVEV